jgi:hypothetical protein
LDGLGLEVAIGAAVSHPRERACARKALQRDATRQTRLRGSASLVIGDNVRRKIQDLITRAPSLVGDGGLRDEHHVAQCSAWITEALNVISYAIPSPQNAYRAQIEGNRNYEVQRVASIAETLRSLLPDIDAGLLGDLGNRVRAEAFDNFLDHGQAYLNDDRKMEAGVIAGVVFEDTIRRIYRDQIADDKDKKLEVMINELTGKSVITGQQSKQAKVAAHVRTKATHARWDEFDTAGVQATIQLTRQFLADHLGG